MSRWAISSIRAADEAMTGMALRAQDITPLHTTFITRLARHQVGMSSRALSSIRHRAVVASRACLLVQGHRGKMSSRALSLIGEPNKHGTVRLAFLHSQHKTECTASIHTTWASSTAGYQEVGISSRAISSICEAEEGVTGTIVIRNDACRVISVCWGAVGAAMFHFMLYIAPDPVFFSSTRNHTIVQSNNDLAKRLLIISI